MMEFTKKALTLAFATGFIVGAIYQIPFTHSWLIFLYDKGLSKLFHWQEFAGAFLGAATPVGLYLLQRAYEKSEEAKQVLLLAEKHIVWAINSLSDIDKMLHDFNDRNLSTYIRNVEIDDQNGRYSVGQAFIPLTPTFVLSEELIKKTTGSQYVENSLMQAISMSKNLPSMIDDLNRQFERTLSLNTQLALIKVNNPAQHNSTLLVNLSVFRNFLTTQIFNNNVPVYLRTLVKAQVAVNTLQKMGMKNWQQKFTFPVNLSSTEKMEKMESLFKQETNEKIETLRGFFKSKLILVGEKSPYEVSMGV